MEEQTLPEGFINFLKPSRASQQEQEQTRPTPHPSNYKDSPFSMDSLTKLRLAGREGKKKANINNENKPLFKKILNLSKAEIDLFSAKKQIELFTIFANWNRIPPKEWSDVLFNAMGSRLENWDPNQFRFFASALKLTPQQLPKDFLDKYTELFLLKFDQFNVQTKLEVLAAELIHGRFFDQKQMSVLLQSTTHSLHSSLGSHQGGQLKSQALKDLYRGLLHFRSLRKKQLENELDTLESAIDGRLRQSSGFSLSEGGTAGAINPPRPQPTGFSILLQKIGEQLPGHPSILEFMMSNRPGFFDPVDAFFPSLRLVVEWDGFHHYFRTIDFLGETRSDMPMVLRPMDSARDAALRKRNIAVLRFQSKDNNRLSNLNVADMVREQNPL